MLTVSMAVIAIVVSTSRMAWVVWLACAVVVTEVLSVVLANREAVLRVSGVALALAFVAAQWLLGRGVKSKSIDAAIDDPGVTMNRWVERTKSQITWSDTTRADWDRRLRPMLARQFELATKRPRARDPKAFEATGRVLFGGELWAWVDPENISRTGAREKGPGRATLTDIIERLERL
jgi:hypothetical protein